MATGIINITKIIDFKTNESSSETIKEKYISDIKEGKKYSYIEEVIEKKDDNVYNNSDVDKIISIILVVHFSTGSINNKEYFSNCSGMVKIFGDDFNVAFISFINCTLFSFL